MFKLRVIFIWLVVISTQAQELDKDGVDSINRHYATGLSILDKEDPSNALDHFKQGLEKAKSHNNHLLIGSGYFHMGDYYLKTKDLSESIDAFSNALQHFEAINDLPKISKCYFEIGYVNGRLSNYEKALFNYYKSLAIKEKLNDDYGQALLLNNIGYIYLYTKDFEKAIKKFNESLEINIKMDDSEGIIQNLSNIGVVYQKSKDFTQAIIYYKKALEKAEMNNLKINQSILLGNIGSSLRDQEKYETALSYLFKALELKKELKRNGSIAHTYNDISETYLKKGQYQEAKKYASESLKFSKKENFNQQKESYQLLSKSNYQLGNYKKSHDNLVTFNTLKDSLFSIEKAASMNEMQVKYETEKRDLKIQAQEADIALLDEKNKVKNQWLIFGGLGLLSIFGIVLLWRSRNAARKREQLQEQFSQDLLTAQEEERTRVSKDLHDSVGQQLTLIKKKAQNLEQEELSAMTNNALEEVRSISRGLFPAALKQLGVTESIQQLLNDLDEETDMFFSVEIDDIDNEFNETETLNLYRFIQETVTNALKHAKAKTLTVNITKHKNGVDVLIKDNGVGFDNVASVKQHSLGLKTIAERIRMLKGTLSIKSKKEEGTLVLAQIPIV